MAEYNQFTRSVYDFIRGSDVVYRREYYASRFVLDPNTFVVPHDLYDVNPASIGRTEPRVPEHEILAIHKSSEAGR
jgi:hypothetical protein